MPDLDDVVDRHAFASEYLRGVRQRWSRKSRILILVDGSVSVHPVTGLSPGFGISGAIAELRNFSAGFASFDVTLATRDGPRQENLDPGPFDFRYQGFRFDQGGANSVLNNFDQVWCFGWWPGNFGNGIVENNPNSLDPAGDEIVTDPSFNPLSEAELAVLTSWMNGRPGGVFATGDHHLLGATMSFAIPRVSTMRRWLIRDQVPTLSEPTRFDTNQPVTPEERAGLKVISDAAEEDAVAQPIGWVPEYFDRGWPPRKMPHPILCHPTLGAIDLLPDHPHEGFCHDPEDPAWLRAKGEATFNFNGLAGKHYPSSGSLRPLPKVIAWGQTLGSPPLEFAKGPQPARRVPLIVVYDGQLIDLGRVVVDSTWHHWFDMNLQGLREATDNRPYQKVARYFINVAIWLASPSWRAAMTLGHAKAAEFDYFGLEEIDLDRDPEELGMAVLRHLGPKVGPCWVRDLASEAIAAIDPAFMADRGQGRAFPTRPPADYVHAVVLGEILKELYSDRGDALRQLAEEGKIHGPPKIPDDPMDVAVRGARRGLARITRQWREDVDKSLAQLASATEALGKQDLSEARPY
ncbi:MAG: hypothetical protein M3177_04025 [Pseudomonadota bacterium]|nr:hypothetical protein [Pseudomonadota bacterium]